MARASNPVDIPRLSDAVRSGRRVLERFRAERRELARRHAGTHWSDETDRRARPLNLISLYFRTVLPHLIAKNPRVDLSTFLKRSKPIASAMQAWANKELVRLRFAEVEQRVVVDGLTGLGILKVALAAPHDSAMSGWNLSAGTPSCWAVDLDDWSHDARCRDIGEASFVGHRSRVPLDSIRDNKLYTAARKKLRPMSVRQTNEDGDERIGMLGTGYTADDDEFEDMVDIWELYLPRRRLVITLPADEDGGPICDTYDKDVLLEREWIGPDSGPYHYLRFGLVPGNAMPKGPALDLLDLDEHVNGLLAKLIEQAARQKENLIVSGVADGDADRIINAADGVAIRVDNPDKIKSVGWGGPHPNNQQFSMQLRDLFSWLAGNLDIMGGLSPQSKTATQDKMLNENSARAVVDMQATVIDHVARGVEAMCWFWHHHPQKVMKSAWEVPGVPGMGVMRQVTPEQRKMVRWEDLEIRVDPYSLQRQTPQAKLAFLNQVVMQILTPLAPLLQQQGVFFDVNAYLTKVGELGDAADLTDIVKVQAPPVEESTGATEPSHNGPRMPVATERTYNRVNSSEATQQGQNKSIQQALLGQNPGGSRASANGTMYAPTGG